MKGVFKTFTSQISGGKILKMPKKRRNVSFGPATFIIHGLDTRAKSSNRFACNRQAYRQAYGVKSGQADCRHVCGAGVKIRGTVRT